jgi:hypothetical protein
VLVPLGVAERLTKTLLVTGRALAPPPAAVTVTVAQPAGASCPAALRPFQRTFASRPVPVQARTSAPLEPVTATRQRAVELKRAWTPA